MKKNSLFLLAAIGIAACAKMVNPTGGEKDMEPPRVVKSKPANRSVNFKGKKLEITFSEFLTLKNASQELLVSPPMAKKPLVKLRDNVMLVQFEDSLRQNSTYTFDFGNSITDLTEGNILKNYKFSFSTGPEIDSLYFSGKVFDAYTLQPLKNISVTAYRQFSDSTPCHAIPDYVARSLEDGSFVLSNISPGAYHVFALKDANQNHLFDNPKEEIAFADSVMNPGFELVEHADTFKLTDTIVDADTVFRDSIVNYSRWEVKSSVDLYLFQELYEKQYIETSKRLSPEKLLVQFKRPLVQMPEIVFANHDVKFVPVLRSKRDSVQLWLPDTAYWYTDSLEVYFHSRFINISFDTIARTDTIWFRALPRTDSASIKYLQTPLKLTSGIRNNGSPELFHLLYLLAENPIKNVIPDSLKLSIVNADSSMLPIQFSWNLLDKNPCILKINASLPENSKINFIAPKGSITDIYNRVNDSIEINFKTKSLENYGTLKFIFSFPIQNKLIQLLDEKLKVLREWQIGDKNTAELKNILPGKYRIRLINDENRNRRWDTGHFVTRRKPEKVWIFDQLIEVKANWDYEFNWNIK